MRRFRNPSAAASVHQVDALARTPVGVALELPDVLQQPGPMTVGSDPWTAGLAVREHLVKDGPKQRTQFVPTVA